MNRWTACGVLVLVGAVACGSCDGAPKPGTAANQQLCDRLGAVGQDVHRLRSLDASRAASSDIRVLVDQTRVDLGRAAVVAHGGTATRITLVSGAYNALSGALRALPPSLTAQQAYQDVKPQVLALDAAFNLAGFGVHCSQ